MKQQPRNFESRQYMLRSDAEAFYYSDADLRAVMPHQHDFYELLFFLEGDVTYMIGETAYKLVSGDLLVIPRGIPHHPVFSGTSRYRRIVLWLTPDFVASLPQGEELAAFLSSEKGETDTGRLYRFRSADGSAIMECAMSIAEEFSYQRPYADTMTTLLVTRLLILIHRMAPAADGSGGSDSASQQLVQEVVSFIDENLHHDLTLDYIADHFFISKFYLSRVFRRHMGTTTHSYISQRRLFRARQLLYDGQAPSDVCRACGYTDYSVFYRAFKDRYNVSPRQVLPRGGQR